MSSRIALLGECMIELNGKPFGTMQQAFGGDTLNTAVYLARASHQADIQVHYVTAMGRDPLSQQIIERWQQAGIDTSSVLIDQQRHPGLYLIQLDERGERTFLYWRNDSAARYFMQHPQLQCVKQATSEADAFYLSGISLAILPAADRATLLEWLGELHKAGTQIIFDSNYRPALWESQAEAQTCYQQLFAMTELALVTDDDEQALWGDVDVQQTLQRLKFAGVQQAVVKQGAAGCTYQALQANRPAVTVPTQAVKTVVDTTSAGDSFNAGFLAGFLQGLQPEECARMGHQLAGIVIQHKGAIIPESATRAVTDTFIMHTANGQASH
ncbi:TPA: sugar kinase [Aeromonas sobria]|nr:sugar kinase [Aeromonas sobria]